MQINNLAGFYTSLSKYTLTCVTMYKEDTMLTTVHRVTVHLQVAANCPH